ADRGVWLPGPHRVAELVFLVIEFDDRTGQGGAFVHAEPGRERARGDVAHHDFERDDFDFADQLLAHVEPLDEMGRNADLAEPLEQILGDAVVEDALALDLVVLLVVEGGGVVLEMLNERARFGPLVQVLSLSFVDAPAAVHIWVLTHDYSNG